MTAAFRFKRRDSGGYEVYLDGTYIGYIRKIESAVYNKWWVGGRDGHSFETRREAAHYLRRTAAA